MTATNTVVIEFDDEFSAKPSFLLKNDISTQSQYKMQQILL